MIEPIFNPSTAQLAVGDTQADSVNPTLSPPCDNPAHHHGLRKTLHCPFCAWSRSLHLQTPPIITDGLAQAPIGVVHNVIVTRHHRLVRFEAPPRAPPATLSF